MHTLPSKSVSGNGATSFFKRLTHRVDTGSCRRAVADGSIGHVPPQDFSAIQIEDGTVVELRPQGQNVRGAVPGTVYRAIVAKRSPEIDCPTVVARQRRRRPSGIITLHFKTSKSYESRAPMGAAAPTRPTKRDRGRCAETVIWGVWSLQGPARRTLAACRRLQPRTSCPSPTLQLAVMEYDGDVHAGSGSPVRPGVKNQYCRLG